MSEDLDKKSTKNTTTKKVYWSGLAVRLITGTSNMLIHKAYYCHQPDFVLNSLNVYINCRKVQSTYI